MGRRKKGAPFTEILDQQVNISFTKSEKDKLERFVSAKDKPGCRVFLASVIRDAVLTYVDTELSRIKETAIDELTSTSNNEPK